MSNMRFIEIDSSYRNRTEFPYPSQFVVQLSQSGNKNNGLTALDPILDAYPYYPPGGSSPPAFSGGTATLPALNVGASSIDNFYIGSIIEDVTLGQYRTIVAYNGTTRVVTLDSPFVGWNVTDTFVIRRGIPIETNTLTGGSISTFVLPGTSSTVSNFYQGQYIWIRTGPAAGSIRRILSYDGTTQTGTVGPNFSAPVGAGDSYEILNFTRDNVSNLVYTGSTVSQEQMVCYEIDLINLIIPNNTLYSGIGGLPAFLPYLYVHFGNASAPSANAKNIIYSNNPNATNALFRVPMDDVSDPILSRFLKIDGNGMKQTIKFKPNDNLQFTVTLPDGELFLTRPDNFSPLFPDPEIQISAAFSIKRL